MCHFVVYIICCLLRYRDIHIGRVYALECAVRTNPQLVQ